MYKNLLRWRQAMLEGAKVRLRPVKDSDWDIYGAWNNDAEVSVGQNDLFMPFNADQLENLFKMWRIEDPASGFTCTIETLDGQVVGTISIYGIKSPARRARPPYGRGGPNRGGAAAGPLFLFYFIFKLIFGRMSKWRFSRKEMEIL